MVEIKYRERSGRINQINLDEGQLVMLVSNTGGITPTIGRISGFGETMVSDRFGPKAQRVPGAAIYLRPAICFANSLDFSGVQVPIIKNASSGPYALARYNVETHNDKILSFFKRKGLKVYVPLVNQLLA